MKLSSIVSYAKKNLLTIILLIAFSYLFLENITLMKEIKSIKSEIGYESYRFKREKISRYSNNNGIMGRLRDCENNISDLESRMEEINNSVDDLMYKNRKSLFTIPLGTAGSSLGEKEKTK